MEMKIVRKSSRNNNVIPASEVIGHVMKVEDISKIKPARINLDKWTEDVTDMEAGADGKRRNDHTDAPLDDIDEKTIALDKDKFDKGRIRNIAINGETGQMSATYLDGTVVTIDMFKAIANDCPDNVENPESILNKIRLHRINWENCSEGITPV